MNGWVFAAIAVPSLVVAFVLFLFAIDDYLPGWVNFLCFVAALGCIFGGLLLASYAAGGFHKERGAVSAVRHQDSQQTAESSVGLLGQEER